MLWVVPCPALRTKIQSFTVCVFSLAMPFLRDQSSGTKWKDSTRSVRSKVKSSRRAKFTRRRSALSVTTASICAIWPVLIPSTCTRSTEMCPCVVLFPRCTWKCQVVTQPSVTLSRSSEPLYWITLRWNALRLDSLPMKKFNSQRRTTSSAHLTSLSAPESVLTGPLSIEYINASHATLENQRVTAYWCALLETPLTAGQQPSSTLLKRRTVCSVPSLRTLLLSICAVC